MSEDLLERLWRLQLEPAVGGEVLDATLSVAEGQALQGRLMERWAQQGESVGGWKIGMTSGASRNAMGEGVRPFGFVLASRIRPRGARLSLAELARGGVENELCLILGESLGADATAQSARASVAAVAPAFEINQRRLARETSTGVRVADNLSNWGIVVGEAVSAPSDMEALEVVLSGNGQELGRVASRGHIDDHFESLAALARALARYGHSLQPGHRVITGAYARTPFAEGVYRGEFDQGIGAVEVELVP